MCLAKIYMEDVQKSANMCSILRNTHKIHTIFMKDSNRCNLLFVLDNPVTLYIVGKDIS